ncbi:hypothetical protein RCL_jg18300.t1 [Rhizophagus clarus]|uniref:Uncharacterized protein n=1 Tax=Rhizophagus clarus TaxID=94130 RepID=A0A8H3LFI0_9GLOM|nr:hypothetical protein RCL_jg18300.t1 [Rhizophagus clarus]
MDRWKKTLESIRQENMQIYISGFYKGHSPKEELNTYHLINLIELNFETIELILNVQFTLTDEQDSNDNTAEILDNKKSTQGKKATRSKRSSKNSESKPPLRKSPRKRGGILDIAVNKIIEINDNDDISQKSDTSFIDTEFNYHIQNNDEMHDEDDDASN